MQIYKADIIKWLKILLYCQIAALVFTLLDYIPLSINLFLWPKRLCQVGSILCLFGLAFAGRRYRIAAIFGTIQFSLTIIQSVIFVFVRLLMWQGIYGTEDFEAWSQFCAVLNLVGMVAGWVYLYHYFHAHGDLIQDDDPALSRKWNNLFFWELAAGILLSIASMIFSNLYLEMETQLQNISTLFYTVIRIPRHIVALLGILYLNRTIHIVQNWEE